MFFTNSRLLLIIACLFIALAVGTFVRIAALRGVSDEKAQSSFKSLKTWWGLAGALAAAMLFGPLGVAVLLATAGILSLREYLSLVGSAAVGDATKVVVFAFVPLYYLLALLGYDEELRSCAPVAFVLTLGALRACLGITEDFIRTTAAMAWGLMLFVFCLSHVFFLLVLPMTSKPWVGVAGWCLYLVLLTETNDIAQALVGRRYGKTKLTPRISPNKSLEGFLGGIAISMAFAVLLSPCLTTLMLGRSWNAGILLAMLSGLLIAVFGFLGDINKSGIKRDVGVKDSGTLLPGQGGMMDRIDSLTFSAPVFYYFVRLFVTST